MSACTFGHALLAITQARLCHGLKRVQRRSSSGTVELIRWK